MLAAEAGSSAVENTLSTEVAEREDTIWQEHNVSGNASCSSATSGAVFGLEGQMRTF